MLTIVSSDDEDFVNAGGIFVEVRSDCALLECVDVSSAPEVVSCGSIVLDWYMMWDEVPSDSRVLVDIFSDSDESWIPEVGTWYADEYWPAGVSGFLIMALLAGLLDVRDTVELLMMLLISAL